MSLISLLSLRVVFQTNEKLIEHLWAPNLHFLTTERWLHPLGKELILSYRPDWNGSQRWRTPAQWRSSGTGPCTTTATSDSQLVSFDASTPMFATNVRARPLVSCICTPALSPCIQYCQISKWDEYTNNKSNVIRHLLHVLHQLPARRAALPGSLCLPFQLHTWGGNRTHTALTLRSW